MIVVGTISGTSMDGLDVAVAELTGAEEVSLRPIGALSHSWPPDLRRDLLALLPPASTTIEQVARLDVRVGQEVARAVQRAVAELAGGTADLVVSHGQTVFHWVEGAQALGTLQLGQPAPIAELTGLPVVSDVRARDIAAGGHGAPLAGTMDALLLAGLGTTEPTALLNLGGIANVTVAGGDSAPVAFDTGPASCLLDAVVARLSDGVESCDRDGARAASGMADESLLERMMADPYFDLPAPKSTGRELFTLDWVDRHLAAWPGTIDDDDLLATLTELTARTIAEALHPWGIGAVYASGGGTHNPTLMSSLQRLLAPARLRPAEDLGLPADDKEAYLMALIGYLTWIGRPGVLPGLTGARAPRVLGRITPPSPDGLQPPRTLRLVTDETAD